MPAVDNGSADGGEGGIPRGWRWIFKMFRDIELYLRWELIESAPMKLSFQAHATDSVDSPVVSSLFTARRSFLNKADNPNLEYAGLVIKSSGLPRARPGQPVCSKILLSDLIRRIECVKPFEMRRLIGLFAPCPPL